MYIIIITIIIIIIILIYMWTFVNKVTGLYLRSVPGNKVHAVCKMHQIKCAGILG